MKKNVWSILLAMTMTVGLLAGCSGSAGATQPPAAGDESQAEAGENKEPAADRAHTCYPDPGLPDPTARP